MSVTFPNESTAYRRARNELLDAEIALRAQLETVAAKRRALPMGGEIPQDYVFTDTNGNETSLSSLFGDKSTLALYSYMYGEEDDSPCPACTSLLDGLNGHVMQLGQRIAFAAVSSARPDKLAAIGKARGWKNIRLISAQGTSYQAQYHGQVDGAEQPMMNVFHLKNGAVRHFWGTEMLHAKLDGHPRHMDLVWPIWGILDMTPEGRGEFFPKVFDH